MGFLGENEYLNNSGFHPSCLLYNLLLFSPCLSIQRWIQVLYFLPFILLIISEVISFPGIGALPSRRYFFFIIIFTCLIKYTLKSSFSRKREKNWFIILLCQVEYCFTRCSKCGKKCKRVSELLVITLLRSVRVLSKPGSSYNFQKLREVICLFSELFVTINYSIFFQLF